MTTVALALTACSTCGIPNSLSKIKPGMKADEVQALIGTPTRIEQSETTGLLGEVDYYSTPAGVARIVYLNNAVFKAEFVPQTNKS